tara:strand:+ start:244 stop:579 length:336 start_codon:yes stop_codon:yes gene_type:complete
MSTVITIKAKDNGSVLPCPFCGDNNCLVDPYYNESYIRCQKCDTVGPTGDYNECVRLWNIRVETPAQSLAKVRADAIRSVLDTPHDCETPNGDIAWSSRAIEEHANKIEGG